MALIQDTSAIADLQAEWHGVDELRNRVKASSKMAAAGYGAMYLMQPGSLAEIAHNLPLVHACSVLNSTLEQIRDEGLFQCSSNFLGPLMGRSKTSIPWIDYTLIEEIRDRRNDIAHRGAVASRDDCERYIDAIHDQLVAWGVLTL